MVTLLLYSFCFCQDLVSQDTKLMFGCWLPYWRAAASVTSFVEHSAYFDQASPFAYDVDSQGTIIDSFKKNIIEWDRLIAHCHRNHILIVPTIFWSDTSALCRCLNNKINRIKHAESIVRLVLDKHYDGININYERVHPQNRWHFIDFMQYLAKQLHANEKVLYCSMGGRVSDSLVGLYPNKAEKKNAGEVHVSLDPGRGKSSVRYKALLAQCCDQVHVMGYDEWGRPYQYNKEDHKSHYYISHCSKQWIESIIRYALSFVPAEKLVLGIPTYGLEFIVGTRGKELFFKKARNLTYRQACELTHASSVVPQRTSGGELSFLYNDGAERRYVCYVDSVAIKERIDIARRYGLKGVYIFKVDGVEDPAMWDLFAPSSKKQGVL